MNSLKDKKILITGAHSGIGRSLVKTLLNEEAQLILTAQSEKSLGELYDEFGKENVKVYLLDYEQNEFDPFVQGIDKLDGFVNLVGISPLRAAKFTSYSDLHQSMQINFMGPTTLINMMLKKKKLNKNSSVVLISSISGCGMAVVGLTSYAASKAALIGYAQALALEISPNIRINCISPGMIETNCGMYADTMNHISSEELQKDIERYPMGRYGKPDEVSNLIKFLLSDEASWITGQNYIIDGGRMLK